MANGEGISDLKARLDQPDTADALGRLLDRMEGLEASIALLTEAAKNAPLAASAAIDAMDATVARMQDAGVDVDERMAGALRLADRLTDPETVRAVEALVDVMGQAPGMASMVADAFDGVAARVQASGIDIDERLASILELGDKLTARATVDGLGRVLDPRAVSIVGMLGGSLVSCFEECMTLPEPRRYGPFKAMAALRDPDAQRGLAFIVNVARFFGQEMGERHKSLARQYSIQPRPGGSEE